MTEIQQEARINILDLTLEKILNLFRRNNNSSINIIKQMNETH